MPPSASTSCGKLAKFTSTRWLTSMPRNCSTVRVASAAPPNAYAALILLRPWPGMFTTVSRGVDSVASGWHRRCLLGAAAERRQQARVRARGLADRVGAGLVRALQARVGAEHQDRV